MPTVDAAAMVPAPSNLFGADPNWQSAHVAHLHKGSDVRDGQDLR